MTSFIKTSYTTKYSQQFHFSTKISIYKYKITTFYWLFQIISAIIPKEKKGVIYLWKRNVAIIAHVDHGKTTLVDEIIKYTHTFRENEDISNLSMDTNDIEKEKYNNTC